MTVYNGMPHGFLNYVGPLDMKEAYVCVKDSADFVKELLAMRWIFWTLIKNLNNY